MQSENSQIVLVFLHVRQKRRGSKAFWRQFRANQSYFCRFAPKKEINECTNPALATEEASQWIRRGYLLILCENIMMTY
jgi:hypothetical protein